MSESQFEPKIVGFLCNWCAYAGADLAGVSRLQYPPNMRPFEHCVRRPSGLIKYSRPSKKGRTAFLSAADTSVIAITCTVIT